VVQNIVSLGAERGRVCSAGVGGAVLEAGTGVVCRMAKEVLSGPNG